MKNKSVIFLSVLAAVVISSYRAEAGIISEWTNFIVDDVKDIYNNEHDYDLYVPFYAWHNRLTYDNKHIKKYNEYPWGAGFGISHTNSEQTWSGIYAMAFKDSNSYVETYFGYSRQWHWCAGEDNQWRAGIGYALGLTQRHEYAYIPVPLPLPILSVGYRNFNINGAYVPGVKNDGNVMFMFARINF